MIVCVCRRVSHREIESQASECDSFDELQMNTGIATACGRCSDCAQAVFRQARQANPCIRRAALGDEHPHAVA
jgi:bacterioferritin-associated ferredoxin